MDIENYCGVVSTAKFAYIKAYDVYSPNIPLKEAMKLDILLVFISGEELHLQLIMGVL